MERLNSIVVLGSPGKLFVILLLRTTQNNEVGTKCVLTNIYFFVEDITSHIQKHEFCTRQLYTITVDEVGRYTIHSRLSFC